MLDKIQDLKERIILVFYGLVAIAILCLLGLVFKPFLFIGGAVAGVILLTVYIISPLPFKFIVLILDEICIGPVAGGFIDEIVQVLFIVNQMKGYYTVINMLAFVWKYKFIIAIGIGILLLFFY